MKLDHLTDVEPEYCPIVRLDDFDACQVELIRERVLALAQGLVEPVRVHELSFMTRLGNCRLNFKLGEKKDFGIRQTTDGVLE